MKDILELSRKRMIGQTPHAVVAADDSWIEQVSDSSRGVIPGLSFVSVGRKDALPDAVMHGAEVLILEVDVNETATLDRVADIRRTHPDVPIIAAVAHADLHLMRILLRHGVSDAVALPLDMEELTAEICNIGARLAEPRQHSLAPVVGITGSLARTGASAVLLHLASEIVAQSEDPVSACIIDLDIQSGQLETHAGVEAARSVLDLLEAEERVDADMLRNVAVKVREGVHLITAPREIVPIEQVHVDQLFQIVALARSEFDLVFIDMPAAWTNWSLSIAAEADRLLLLTEQTLPHLRQTRRCLDLFREVGMEKGKIGLVVNRARTGRFVNISVQDVADTLDREVLAVIREDRGDLTKAIDEGRLVSDIARRSVFAEDIATLADLIRPKLMRSARS